MSQDPAQAATLLMALMATQFLVHAAGWAMASAMQHQARGPEAHFAAFWLALAAAMALYAGPWLPDHPVRALADWMVLCGLLLVHRGLLGFFRRPVADRGRIAAAACLAALLAASLHLPGGHRLRLVGVSLAVGGNCAALGWVFWCHGRARTPHFAPAVALTLAAAAVAFVLRALLAATAAEPVRLAFGVQSAYSAAYGLGVFFVAGLFNLAQIRLVLGRIFLQLRAQSQIDPLTGVANRRGFLAALGAAHAAALRDGGRYALLMVDIDHFKRINDEHGHAAGDAALHRVAQTLATALRAGDSVGRWGGEEFCLLLPGADLAGAAGLAQRVCSAMAAAQGPTVSVGVALVDAAAESPESALRRADAALYRAKSAGRNRVVVD